MRRWFESMKQKAYSLAQEGANAVSITSLSESPFAAAYSRTSARAFALTSSSVPGVTQTINYALTKDDKQIVYYIATVDISRDDVNVYANYHANDPSLGWAMSRVSDQMAAGRTHKPNSP